MSHVRVDAASPVPIFRQIADGLRAAIAAGVYRPGELVPSVRQQALALIVNPNTVQRAYDELERDGVLVSKRGVGMQVAAGSRKAAQRDVTGDVREALAAAVRNAAAGGLSRDAVDALYAQAWKASDRRSTP